MKKVRAQSPDLTSEDQDTSASRGIRIQLGDSYCLWRRGHGLTADRVAPDLSWGYRTPQDEWQGAPWRRCRWKT